LHSRKIKLRQEDVLILKKRRYVCKVCKKKFCEEVNFLPKYQRMTNRLAAWIISQLSNTTSIKVITKITNVSYITVYQIGYD